MSHDVFNSKFGAIAAAAGSAVGLGNIWRFPYILGENGGGAFLIIYIIFTVAIALPILLSEFATGRKAAKPVIGAYKKLAPGTKWYFIGLSGVFCAFFILSFYSIVSGWMLFYCYKAIVGNLSGLSSADMISTFESATADPAVSIFWMILFLGVTSFVVMRGVQKGIEKYSKVLMPLLLLLIIIICVRALTLPGAIDGLVFLFRPDFSKITSESLFVALGQSFFSLSIGMGTMTTYGSYISKRQNLSTSGFSVAILDFVIAILAAIIIFPCAFAFGISPGEGPGLVFVTLPNVFNQMFAGQAISIVFFILLSIAALTSSISLLEVVVSYLVDDFKIKRELATVLSASLCAILGCLCAFSSAIFNLFDNLSANILLPGGAFFIVLFIPWVMGRSSFKKEMEAHGHSMRWFNQLFFLIKYVAPIAIFTILVYQIIKWIAV